MAGPLAAEPIESPEAKTASEILWSIQKLDTLGKALYLAAHPDDENTSLISYLSLGRKYETAYLSLTRGDGGQNLIGPELRDLLGVIRTQELLEARRLDGGRQYFSRAKDFGYSKHPDETFTIWDREKVLADTVWVVRSFRPDVIVTRFNADAGYTHGHHTASTLLALEAFEAAADPARFPEQLEFVEPWRAKRVVWNTSSWFFRRSGQTFDENEYVALEVGGYEPLLGKSFNEIASASRSMHRSQGFGTRIERGSRIEYFKLLAGDPMAGDLFDGIDTSWDRVENAASISARIERIRSNFSAENPAASVPALVALRRELSELPSQWAREKRREVDQIIAHSLGLDLRALHDERYVGAGEQLEVTIEAINRSPVAVRLLSVSFPLTGKKERLDQALPDNQRIEEAMAVTLPTDLPLPQPYWLERPGSVGMSEVSDQSLIGLAESRSDLAFVATLEVLGEQIRMHLPLQQREVDPARGEIMHPIVNLPAATVEFLAPVTLFPNFESKTVQLEVSAVLDAVDGELRLELPRGWRVEPERVAVEALPRGESRVFAFEVFPPEEPQEVSLSAVLDTNRGAFRQGLTRIDYEHIREQNVFSPAETRAVSLEVARRGQRVGYLPGAGDSVPESIREIGYELVELSPANFSEGDLEGLDTVVIGIRAYNTVSEIGRILPHLFDFARDGGTVIAQYNTSHQLNVEQLAPYPISLSRERVTDETAAVRVLAAEHPALTTPNRIAPRDFEGWTQERGLYFPASWDPAFAPLLSINDPGEPPLDGSLLVAPYGDGYFVYTGLSWFRQLPAGVPGAYRMFANLLSLGH